MLCYEGKNEDVLGDLVGTVNSKTTEAKVKDEQLRPDAGTWVQSERTRQREEE